MIIATSAEGLGRKLEYFKSTLRKLKEKGVKIRVAAPLESNGKELSELRDLAQVKHLDKLTARFILVDDREILFMVSDDKTVHESYDTGVWVDTPFFVRTFGSMFNTTWNDLKSKK
mgnify:CR=1 FL=1